MRNLNGSNCWYCSMSRCSAVRAQPGQRGAGGVAQQARLDDLQGEGVIALADEGGGGGGELLVPACGEQVECGGVLGRGGRLESLPVWPPVTGALVVEPLGEVVADHQVRHDRRGVLAEHRGEAGVGQDVGEGAAVADAVQHLAAQLGQRRLEAGDCPGGELLGQRGVAVDEQAGPQAGGEGEGLQESLREPSAANGCPR